MIFGREPTLIINAIKAALLLAVLFGLDLSDVQMAAIIVLVTAVAALWNRSQVTPVADPRPNGRDPIS